MQERTRTKICGRLQASVRHKTDCCEISLRISEAFHHHVHLIAAQLCLNTLQCPFKTQPEINLLRRGTRGNITRELGNRLDSLDPYVDVSVQSVEERTIV